MGEGVDYWRMRISIHAPREGCDACPQLPVNTPVIFQSTHPVRGATLPFVVGVVVAAFQSTPPVRGATNGIYGTQAQDIIFQSTHPVRGATHKPAISQ